MLNDFLNDAYKCSEVTLTLHLQALVKTILKVVDNDRATDDGEYRLLADCLDEHGNVDWDSMNWECLDYWLCCYVSCDVIHNHPAACALRVQHQIEDIES